MEYSRLISISGLGGLFELLSSKTDGAIVRSLDDKSTKFVSSRVHSFSHMESIEVYTQRENVNLVEVFKAMEESKQTLPSEKDPAAIKAYFQKVYPEMDFERVYSSDMKKMVKWFKVLKDNEVEIKLSEYEEEAEETQEETAVEEPKAEEKPKKKAAKKKDTEVATTTTDEEPKPKKKAAKKKTEE